MRYRVAHKDPRKDYYTLEVCGIRRFWTPYKVVSGYTLYSTYTTKGGFVSTSDPIPQPEVEDQQITPQELASEGFDVETDQLSPQDTHAEGHPTPNRPTGRTGP